VARGILREIFGFGLEELLISPLKDDLSIRQFSLLQVRQTKSNISKKPANSKIQKRIKIAGLRHNQTWETRIEQLKIL
jgi:hypothetical protein